jgi:hypothetical protein
MVTMTCPNEITVGDEVYVRRTVPSTVKIVILQRGWVVVGRYSREGDMCYLDNARVIRTWGTTEGIGQLVDGPTASTKLDKGGHMEFHILVVVNMLDVKEDKWASALR